MNLFEFLIGNTAMPESPAAIGLRQQIFGHAERTSYTVVTIAGGSLARDAASHGSEWVTSSSRF